MVMDVIWRRPCVSMIREGRFVYSELSKGATSEAGCISSELLMCGGGVRSILFLPLVARCLEQAVQRYYFFLFFVSSYFFFQNPTLSYFFC